MSNKIIYNFNALSRKYFKTYLGISISIFLFLLFFQPFPTQDFEYENKQLFTAGIGIILFFIQVVVQIMFQKHLIDIGSEHEENSVMNSIYYFTQLALTSIAFIFYIRFVGHTQITFNIVARVIIICLSIPVTIHLKNKIIALHQRIKKLTQESRIMHEKVKLFSENYANRFIELTSDNENDNIRILVSEVVYIKSADNYVEVGFVEEQEFKKKMIRNTLKNIEKQLREFNNFIRTHRSSIVNIQYISKLNKNFNTYWLSLENTSETIPVSRQYLLAVREIL